MTKPQRNAERTKAAILQAARRLFAERGIAVVSIRDIAAAAGVSHGLVQQYFGSREEMVTAIVQREVTEFAAATEFDGHADHDLHTVHELVRQRWATFQDYALLIARAELDGMQPERMLDPSRVSPSASLATMIAGLQAQAPEGADLPDPKLVSAYINASLFGFATMAPWLMTGVGLAPDDYARRMDEITDLTLRIIEMAAGLEHSDHEH